MLRWYDFLFKNSAKGMDRRNPVRVFTMGRNEWRNFDDWPPPGAQTKDVPTLGREGEQFGGRWRAERHSARKRSPRITTFTIRESGANARRRIVLRQRQLAAGPKEQSDIEKRTMCWCLRASRCRQIWM